MAPHEDWFADMIMKLSHFHHYMSSSEGLQLTNSLMKSAEIENEANEHKLKTLVLAMLRVALEHWAVDAGKDSRSDTRT